MPFDASGNFSRLFSWQQDRDNGIRILALRMDGEFDNFAAGMNLVFFRSGLVPMSGNLNLGQNSIIGVASGSAGALGLRFADDPTSGMYLDGLNRPSIAVNSVRRLTATTAGVDIVGTLASGGFTSSGNISGVNGSFSGTLGVNGVTTLSGGLIVVGTTTTPTLNVTANANIGGTLGVTGLTTLAAVSASGNASIGGTLGVTGVTNLNGATITGTTNTGSLNTTANASIGGTLGVTGATGVSTLTSSGLATLASLGVTGASALNAVTATTIAGTAISGTTGTFTGRLEAASTIRATGQSNATSGIGIELIQSGSQGYIFAIDRSSSSMVPLTIQASTIALSGNTSITGTLSTTGAFSPASLGVTGNATVGGTFGVTGATTLGTLTVAGNGAPMVLNSLNSNGNKMGMQDAGVSRGWFGSSVSGVHMADSAGVARLVISTAGAAVTGTFSTSGAATFASGGFTGNATVGGTLGITGITTVSASINRSGQGPYAYDGMSRTDCKITDGTGAPAGGSNGDIYFRYT